MNVPNALTGARLMAVPVFIAFFLRGERKIALGVFVGAMITDALDGILARALKQFTRIGALLDPVADKVLERTGRSYTVRPTRFGKYATAGLAATTVLALVQGATEAAAPTRPLLIALALITAECVVVSWSQYLWLFVHLMRLPPQRQHA